MSRSYRKPVITISNQTDRDTAYKKVRRLVKQELAKDEPDEIVIENDTRDIGAEECGTKIDFIYIDKDNSDESPIKEQKKAKRK